MDRPKRQTSTVTPAKPGDYPFYLRVALLDYAKDLPSSADSGNILLSNASMAIVYRLYVQFQNELPEWATASLETLFQANGTLGAFYEIVGRHARGVPNVPWSRPFPDQAVSRLRDAVRANTPETFERDVAKELGRVEKLRPP